MLGIRFQWPVVPAAAALLGVCPPTAGAQAPEVVARGLDNPRGLTVAADGSIWVAEAGRGGRGPCIPGPEGGRVCLGRTGGITRIVGDRERRLVRGLPSLAARGGARATGPQDIAVRGRDQVWVTVGLGSDPRRRARLGRAGRHSAFLLRLTRKGAIRAHADLARFEARRDPDRAAPGSTIDTNPTSVLAQASRRLVVDAGGNTLLSVGGRGEVSTLTVFPVRTIPAPPLPAGMGPPAGTPIPMQSVPTAVAQDARGGLYVSELTGFPFPRGAARIYKVTPGAGAQVYAEGFTNVVDLAFGPDGSLYVVEIATNGLLSRDPTGALIRLRPDGTRQTVPVPGLTFPGGVAVAANGDVYVTNRATAARQGQVLRIRASG